MKQRLLLALLVLFASVGMVKAADSDVITFKVPKGDGKVTVTVKGTTITSSSHPSIYYGATDNGNTRATSTVSGQSATYTINQDKDGEQTWKIPTSIVLSEISLSGKVASFDATKVSSNDFKNGLKSLSFSNNGELSQLYLWTGDNNSDKGKTNAFPNLETLSCAGNKLNLIPEKGKIKNYTIGKQSPLGLVTINADGKITSNEPLDLTLDKIKVDNNYEVFRSAEGSGNTIVSYGSWKITSETKVGTAKKDNTYDYRYTFIESGNIYASATDFTCTLTVPSTNPQYPGVTIENIPVKVGTASFKVKTEVPNGNGTVKVYKDQTAQTEVGEDEKVAKGSKLLITNVPNENYVLDKDKTTTEGLEEITWSGNNFTAMVKGDKAPVIKSAFKGKDCMITYTDKVEQGTLGVSIVDGAVVASNGKVPYGTKVEIVVVPTEGWAIDQIQANGTAVTANGEGKYITTITSDTRITVTYTNQQTKKVFWKNDPQVEPKVTGGGEWKTDHHEVKTNTEVTFNVTFTSSNNKNYSIEAFLLDGSPLNATKKSDTEYVLSFLMPNHDVTITIKTLELTEVSINVEKEYTTIYNGEGQSMPYKISPNLTDNISVLYKVSSANEQLFTETKPTEKGEYDVKFERPADKVYKAASVLVGTNAQSTSNYAKLKINPAIPNIITAPGVSVKKETKDGKDTYSYAVTKGKAQLNSKTSLDGKWEVVSSATNMDEGITAVPAGEERATKLVYVRFTAQNSGTNDPNYSPAYIQVPATVAGSSLNSFAVTIATLPEGTSLKLYNGAKEIKSGESVLAGTTLTAKMEAEGYASDVKVAAVDDTGKENDLIKVTPTTADKEYTVTITQKTKLGIIGTKQEPTVEIILNPDCKKQESIYTGKPQFFDLTKGILKIKDGDVLNKVLKQPATVTYKNEQGQDIISPINAGIYTVTIERDAIGSYKAFKLTDKLIIKKADPDVKDAKPVATEIAIGQLLSQSQLNGAAPVAGSYQWVKDEKITSAGNVTKAVKFVPLDATNYNEVTLTNGVTVTVSNKTLITFAPINGKITVKDDKGKEYVSGSLVAKNTKLTVTAEPNEGFELKSFTVGNTEVNGNTYSFTFGEETVGIVTEFQLKTPNPAHVVLTLPENGKGYKLSANGAKSVAFNANYTFTVSTLAADKNKVVVKADGETIKANDNGSYTVKGDKDKNIVVTVSNPTKIKVSVEKTTKNAQGFTMGKVEVEGLASDSTCYYNDVITLVAYPESGVALTGWSDAASNTDKLRTLTVTAAMTIKPKFTGVPTGIETIESTRIYGLQGQIFIGYEGEAIVTVVGMDGRMKKVDISGDTRIPMPAGIYGVILQKGTEAITTKVVVK